MVFCKGCKYYEWVGGEYGNSYWCEHPKNLIHCHNHAYQWTRYPDAEIVNKNNDCKLWERKLTLKEKIKHWLTHK